MRVPSFPTSLVSTSTDIGARGGATCICLAGGALALRGSHLASAALRPEEGRRDRARGQLVAAPPPHAWAPAAAPPLPLWAPAVAPPLPPVAPTFAPPVPNWPWKFPDFVDLSYVPIDDEA
jgi:hypothetical protein